MSEWRRVVREDLAADLKEQGGGGGGSSSISSDGSRRKTWFWQGRKGKLDDRRPGGGETQLREGGKGETRRGPGGKGGKRGEPASAWVEELGGYLSLPEVEISTAEEFVGEFVNRSRPAVIKVNTRRAFVLPCFQHHEEECAHVPNGRLRSRGTSMFLLRRLSSEA